MARRQLKRYGGKRCQVDDKYGRWTVVSYAGAKNGHHYWLCRCDCGTEREVNAGSLLTDGSTSCGCYNSEAVVARQKKHGQAGTGRKTVEYRTWAAMIRRCHNPNAKWYDRYGGRGIVVCQEWRDSFEAFFEHLGSQPFPGATLDRIDNARGYEPGNVRWATKKEQARNTRRNHVLEWQGKCLTIAEWAEVVGIPGVAIYQRINKLGWSVEKALTTPPRVLRKRASG